MRHRLFGKTGIVLALVLAQARFAGGDGLNYPPAHRDNVTEQFFGTAVADPYRWLENSDDPNVQRWSDAQNALTRAQLDAFPALREELSTRLIELYSVPSSSSPARYGDNWFYTHHEGTQNHSIVYVRAGAVDAKARLVINPNDFSQDGTVALDWWFPSPDGALVVYGRSAGGSEKSTLHLRDLFDKSHSAATPADTALEIPNTRACSVAWDPDAQGFYYSRYPEAGQVPAGDENYYRHIYHHRFGTLPKDDPEIFGAQRPKEEWNDVSASSDNKYLFLSSSIDWARNDLRVRAFDAREFKEVAVGLDGRFSGDVLGDKLFLLTNYQAPRFRVLAADLDDPGQKSWKEIVPQQKGVIESMDIIDGKLVLSVLEDVHSRLMIHAPDGTLEKEIQLPTLGAVSGISGRPDKPELFFTFQSFVYPPVVFQYDIRSGDLTEFDKAEYPVQLSNYETAQVWFNSKDGTRVPMFVLARKGLPRDGGNPTLLYGYGGFNIAMTPRFAAGLLPWLDRGGVYAIACLRGGSEFGEDWHKAGRLDKKQNVFDDMIAAGEKLVADKYTRPERLGAYGGSNGGLLMGAMITQRPDLFRAVVCAVPLLDMVRYHRLSIARLWIPEYGSSEDQAQFKTLFAYSPYHHVKQAARYPAILFTTAESDSRVDPMHARKMAAEVQAASTSGYPVLLWTEKKAGHGAGKPLKMRVQSEVDRWVFFMWQLGLAGESGSATADGRPSH